MSEVLSYASLLPERKRRTVTRKLERAALVPLVPERKEPKRVGRGIAAGQGKTCGRGHKGQKARSGYSYRKGFEGGQTPIYRRLPKRGFYNPFAKNYQTVNLQNLKKLKLQGELSPALLEQRGLVAKELRPVKILGTGETPAGLSKLTADAFSQSARQKLEKAGCTCVVRELKKERRAAKKEAYKKSKKSKKKQTAQAAAQKDIGA